MQIIQQSRFWLLALVAASISLVAFQARAQSFPSRPVYLIEGIAPGGGEDFAARVLAKNLSKLWGQPVIVESRLGAAGAVANEYVAKAPADGYTLLMASDDITALPALRSNLPYDLLRDFVPVSTISEISLVLAVTPSLPVHSVKDLIALAKSEPGKLSYGSNGVGSVTNLQTARLASMANINMVHVPYKGSSAALIGVTEGEVAIDFGAPNAVMGLAKGGKVRVIGISSPQRWPLLPSIPTISESGLPGYSFTSWFGIIAPAALPKDVLAAINAGIGKAVNSPEMKAALAQQGQVAQSDTPAQFAALIRSDLAEKAALVKLAGLKAQ